MDTIAGRRRSRLNLSGYEPPLDKENVETDNIARVGSTNSKGEVGSRENLAKPVQLARLPMTPSSRGSYRASANRRAQRASKSFVAGSPIPTTPDSLKGLWTATVPVSDSKSAPIDVSKSPLFVKQAQTNADGLQSPLKSPIPDTANTPFKFKVTVGPTRREVIAEVTPRKEAVPVIIPRLPLPNSQEQSSRNATLSDSVSRTDSSGSNSSLSSSYASSSSSRKRDSQSDYTESPAKRRRISFGTKSVRKSIFPVIMGTLSGSSTSSHSSKGRDIPTAESIFEPPVPMVGASGGASRPVSSHTTPVRGRSGSTADRDGPLGMNAGYTTHTMGPGSNTKTNGTNSSNPSTPSRLRLTNNAPATPTTSTAIALDSLALGVHLIVPSSKDADTSLPIQDIAAWTIFGQSERENTLAFLLAYMHFKTTARELFKMVWAFYHQPPLQYWKLASTFSNQRAKVIDFVLLWAQTSPNDFEWGAPNSPSAPATPRSGSNLSTSSAAPVKGHKVPHKFLTKLVDTLIADGSDTSAFDALMESQPKVVLSPRKMAPSSGSSTASNSTSNGQSSTSSSGFSASQVSSPRSRSASASRRTSKYHARRQSSVKAGEPVTFDQIEPTELALQMTFMDFARLRSVPMTELVGQAWNKSDKARAAPRLTNIINNFNNMSYWVAQEIASVEGGAKEQAKVIDRFISVGNKLKSMGNFNGVMQIFSGLLSSNVQRLQDAWKLISSKQMQKYKKFEQIMSPYHNYGAYRTRLAECKQAPVIPYIGIHLGDIVHLLEGTEDEIPDHYAIHKVFKLGALLRLWHQWQKQTCDIAEDSDITQFLALLKGSVVRDQ